MPSALQRSTQNLSNNLYTDKWGNLHRYFEGTLYLY